MNQYSNSWAEEVDAIDGGEACVTYSSLKGKTATQNDSINNKVAKCSHGWFSSSSNFTWEKQIDRLEPWR